MPMAASRTIWFMMAASIICAEDNIDLVLDLLLHLRLLLRRQSSI